MLSREDVLKLKTAYKRADVCRKYYPELYEYIITNYPNLRFIEGLYRYAHNIDRVVCPVCGKEITNFIDWTYGYTKHCSVKCARQDPEQKDKVRKTSMERYGVDNPAKSKVVKEHAKRTSMERYGVDNPAKSKVVKDRIRKSFQDRYGVDHALQLDEFKEKFKQTFQQTRADSIKERHPAFIGFSEGGLWKMSCPHINCNKCVDKFYIIDHQNLSNRERDSIELCTNLLPVGQYRGRDTSIELFVKSILETNGIEFEQSNRVILEGRELDFYIPSHNIAIECNGIYWHSKQDMDYHYSKYKMSLDKGIQLITVWEDQIKDFPEKVEAIILSKLGIYQQRIYARNCEIREVGSIDSRDFLNKYHLQGAINCSVRLGLYYKDELVSLMTFGKGRKCLNSSDVWELYRYCCKSGYQIIGGVSKLFSYFIKKYDPESITSFSSNDISNGSLYKNLNFSYTSYSIGYWYIKNNVRYHRFSFTKHKVVELGGDPKLTEKENMLNLEYRLIYDSGQTKWTWTKTK